MTDFIHEQPKAPQEEKQPAYVPPKSEKEREKKVYAYVLILFCVAMLLLLWASMTMNRSNQKALSELKENSYALQSTMEDRNSLELENAELREEIAALESENDALQQQIGSLQEELEALQSDSGTEP